MPPHVRAFTLCRMFGWTEAQYLDTTVMFGNRMLAVALASAPDTPPGG